MADLEEQVKDALSNVNWKVEIDIKQWPTQHKETLMLPKYLRDHVTDIIRGYIRDKNTITETIYYGQTGNTVYTGEKLIDIINKISKKTGIPTDKLKIRNGDEGDDELTVEYKLPWNTIKLDELAKLTVEREIHKYKTDYETIVRVVHTKEVAND